jgi:hypothetical protein
MDSQGKDSQAEHLFRTDAQNGFSRWERTKWSTSSWLLHRMDSQGEARPGVSPLQDCCTEWILKVRTARRSTSSGLMHRMDSQGRDKPSGTPLQYCCTEWILKVGTNQVEHLFTPRWSTSSGLLHWMDSQGEDIPGGAPLQEGCTGWILGKDRTGGAHLQDCCTEWILKVRTEHVLHIFRTAAQNGFSRWGQTWWSTSSGLLHRMDSQGEDWPGGALLKDCCTEWILKVRIDLVEHLFRTAAKNGFSRWG